MEEARLRERHIRVARNSTFKSLGKPPGVGERTAATAATQRRRVGKAQVRAQLDVFHARHVHHDREPLAQVREQNGVFPPAPPMLRRRLD